ncbi:hypothetical protein DL768_009710 [Monosporascus sp. mg162]|nr:hypothetical protein DL768_009710 [Monosporascus sp. mg162]
MKFIVAPASSKTGRATVQALLNDRSAPLVVGIYRNLGKVPAGFSSYPNFKAVQGDLTDPSALDFAGADGVVVMTPPKYDGSDVIAHARVIAENVRDAVSRASSVKRLVYISSGGAQYSEGVGEIRTNHVSETIYQGAAAEVVFVRNAYFMENWVTALDTIKADPPHFYSTLTPLDHKIPMVIIFAHPICEEPLPPLTRGSATNSRIIDLQGPEWYSTRDVQKAFEHVTGKSVEARLVEKNKLADFFAQFLPSSLVGYYTEMTLSILPGGLLDAEAKNLHNARRGQDTLLRIADLDGRTPWHISEPQRTRKDEEESSEAPSFSKSNKKRSKGAKHQRLSPEETAARYEEYLNHAAAGVEAVDLSDLNTSSNAKLIADILDDASNYEENNAVPSTADVGMLHSLMNWKDAQARI